MSAKSSNLRTSVSGEGEFLHELEEKLEVARIQMQVYEALMRIKTGPAAAHLGHALAVLNSRLMDITTVRFPFPVSRFQVKMRSFERYRSELMKCKFHLSFCNMKTREYAEQAGSQGFSAISSMLKKPWERGRV